MKMRIAALAFIAAAAGIFALMLAKNAPPSDFRDAVASQSFDTAIPVFEKDTGNLPVPAPSRTDIAPAALPEKKPVKDWTVMYYINGKNNLDKQSGSLMYDLEAVGSNARVNIVVERGSIGKGGEVFDYDKENWTGSRRYYVTTRPPNTDHLRVIHSKILWSSTDVDMGAYLHAVYFVAWAKANFPAKHYMFVINNHGSGIRDPEKKPSSNKGISFDDQTGNYITNVEIGKILRPSGGVDVLVFAACLMQSAEIAYELKGLADFVVGSEETSWGLDFGDFIKGLVANPAINGEQAARLLLKSETAQWADWIRIGISDRRWSQFSILRLSEFDAFVGMLNRWTGLVEEVNDIPAVRAAINGAMRFTMYSDDPKQEMSLYGDLSGFIRLFNNSVTAKHPRAGELKTSGSELLNFLERRLIVANVTTGKNEAGRSLADAHGLSIYLPASREYGIVYSTKPTQCGYTMVNGICTAIVGTETVGIPGLVDGGPEHRAQAESFLGGKYADFAFAKGSRWYEFVKYLWSTGRHSVSAPEGGSVGGFEDGCKEPGPNASSQERTDYSACLERAIACLDRQQTCISELYHLRK